MFQKTLFPALLGLGLAFSPAQAETPDLLDEPLFDMQPSGPERGRAAILALFDALFFGPDCRLFCFWQEDRRPEFVMRFDPDRFAVPHAPLAARPAPAAGSPAALIADNPVLAPLAGLFD